MHDASTLHEVNRAIVGSCLEVNLCQSHNLMWSKRVREW